MEHLKQQLLNNNIDIITTDLQYNFFSVSKNNIYAVISFNNFNEDLQIFLDSVELFRTPSVANKYDINYINSNNIDFSKIEENQIKDLMLDGFKLDYLLTLDTNQLDNLFCKYND